VSRAVRTPQIEASDPKVSAFVAAHAGSGKTTTLVTRVARLLLAGAAPEAILCVTFTKAAAAEMQRRLFKQLGDWAVMEDPDLTGELVRIDEAGRDLPAARRLFAKALETPGGLKIQTIHAFCEKLLRRFPLEAGVAPGFTVLDDTAAAELSHEARAQVAAAALAHPRVAEAYDHFSIELDHQAFEDMFDAFAARRAAIAAFLAACPGDDFEAAVWSRCGFNGPGDPAEIEAELMARTRRESWRRRAEALTEGRKAPLPAIGAGLLAAAANGSLREARAAVFTQKGSPRVVKGADPTDAAWIAEQVEWCAEAWERVASACVARETTRALTLASAYIAIYEDRKDSRGALDFADLVTRSARLLTAREDAAWVLYKLDGGLQHLLLDEGQDTAPEQWEILKTLTGEFFDGVGAAEALRTLFAVGDPKQSIFSFQGAVPERFAMEGQAFQARAAAAGMAFRQTPLQENWRSAAEVLGFVDAVFADPASPEGLHPAEVEALPLRHVARREGGGAVELWPLEQSEPSGDDDDPWDPVDKEPAHSGNRLLAERIAAAIADMVANGEAVLDPKLKQPRPCRYGDVLILVRRRKALFEEVIRALKERGVPVAGADRLELKAHGLFADLAALGRFARFPSDDFSLAVLLRSPFCDVDEDGLFDLAYGREGRLWRALQTRAPERKEWADALRFLAWAASEAATAPPFDFYCRALGRIDGEGRSMRQRIVTRFGMEAEPALEAFVGQALAAERAGVVDLESWLGWMEALDLEIKREADEAGANEVRVMTVHGAKGLEAPIVILPDTTMPAKPQGGGLIDDGDGGFLWAPRQDDDCEPSRLAKSARERDARREYARLLYVALTRARDRLIVAGVAPKQAGRMEGSWYEFVERAFDRAAARPFALPGGGEGRRLGADPIHAAAPEALAPAAANLPAWSQGLAPAEPPRGRRVSPSHLGEDDPGPAPSPLAEVGGLGRWRRGEIIHRLLQVLPDLPPAERRAAAVRLLAREPGLSEAQCAEMADAAFGVLEDARFAAMFGPGSRSEAAVVGGAASLPADMTVSGRLDRLVVGPDRVLIADFKTNRPAPARIEDADPAYLRQMAIYRAVLAEVFPGRPIEAALVWTDGPALMPVPAALMDRALAELAA